MHEFRSGSALLLDAEVDSMGGVIDGGVGIGSKTSPHRAAIEKAQAELRLEYDVREERRRELEFLEKGGNPLDFKFGHAASLSVQSTSLPERLADQLVSEVKGSYALPNSPHGDSVESSGRLGMALDWELNSADNFDGDNQLRESETKTEQRRSIITPSEHSSKHDGHHNAEELEDSPIFHPKRSQAYRRRNRSRGTREVTRSSSTNVASRGGQNSFMSGRNSADFKAIDSDKQMNLELVGADAVDSSSNSVKVCMLEEKPAPSANTDVTDHRYTENLKANGSRLGVATEEPDCAIGSDLAIPVGITCHPAGPEKLETHDSHGELNDSSKSKGEEKCTKYDAVVDTAACTLKGLDSESSCTQTSLSVDGNGIIASESCDLRHVVSNGVLKGENLASDKMPNSKDDKIFEVKHVSDFVEHGFCSNDDQNSVVPIHQSNGFTDKDEKKFYGNRSSLQNEASCSSHIQEIELAGPADPKSHTKDAHDGPNPGLKSSSHEKVQGSRDSCNIEVTHTVVPGLRPTPELPTPCENQLKTSNKAQEDRILTEARIIEAKRKRFAALSERALPRGFYKKSHWDFVVEEMAWLANDFAQERLWKVTAAAQICHQAALACCLRSEENNKHGKLRTIARTLANAVMEFWHFAESSLQVDGLSSGLESRKYDADAFRKIDDIGLAKGRIRCPDEEVDETTKLEHKICGKNLLLPVQGYAIRFLQCNSSATPIVRDETFSDLASDVTVPDISWQDHFTEENLFYMVPPGSMESYRKSIESYLVCSEKKGNRHEDDAGTSMYDTTAEFGSQENDAEEDEGESVYYLPGQYEGRRSLKIVHKKRNNIKSYASRSCEFGGYGNFTGSMVGPPQFGLMGKRSINGLNVGPIPTKRMRTASRQRVLGPPVEVAVGGASTPTRTGASSGDTNSLPDDHNMQHEGFTTQKGPEVEWRMDFDNQSILDAAEVPLKSRKKKAKHQASTSDQKWTLETLQNEQRNHLKKRSDATHFESNGTSGLFVHQAKKPKLMKQLDNSFGNVIPMSGTMASPVGSQMSNMSNANKLTKFIIGRDQGRKARLAKGSVHQPGCGSEWTLYEDQALVVLVHDMGPNWELVSDAFNSTLLFKGAFRRPSECKERHRALMDGPSGDGADSEDSGSSQPYKSTLPGIPKGSARQLFQKLQEPLEEDTIKSHFEKIALLGSRFPNRNKLSGSRDLKQIAPIHGSHFASLSQVFPNNLNGAVLTPLDLCDASASSPDVFPLVCQPPASLGIPTQGVIPPMISPGGNASLQNSPGMGIRSNLMTHAHPNGSVRDGRYNVPRIGNMPIDEQQRVQKHSHMMLNRNIPPNKLVPLGALSAADPNIHMLPGGGMEMKPGMNKDMQMRQGLQRIPSSSAVNLGMPTTSNKNSGASPGQGKSILGPRDAMHMPNQIAENQRQMMLSEMQLQAIQGSTQGVPPYGGLSSPLPNQSASSPVQMFPVHHQQQHQVPRHLNALTNPHHPLLEGGTHPSAEQQAYLRAARQQQQRMLRRQQQQQTQFSTSNALMAHSQTQSHLPTSSPVRNNSQMQSPAFSQTVPLPALMPSSPMTPTSHQQQKHVLPPHGLGRNSQSNAGGGMNQIAKQHGQSTQLQHQQFQQSDRHHLHQRLQSQSIQQAKRLNGVGRSTMSMHQNLPHDPSQPNGLSRNQVNQPIEKGEQAMRLMQGHEVMSPGSKHPVPRQPSGQPEQQQKSLSSSTSISAQQVQQMTLHHEDSNVSQVKTIPSSAVGVPASTQGLQTSAMPPQNQKLQGCHQASVKFISQSQAAIQRSIQQNCQASSNLMENLQSEQSQEEEQFMNNSLPLGVDSGTSTACIEPSNAVTVPSQIGSTASPQNPFSS